MGHDDKQRIRHLSRPSYGSKRTPPHRIPVPTLAGISELGVPYTIRTTSGQKPDNGLNNPLSARIRSEEIPVGRTPVSRDKHAAVVGEKGRGESMFPGECPWNGSARLRRISRTYGMDYTWCLKTAGRSGCPVPALPSTLDGDGTDAAGPTRPTFETVMIAIAQPLTPSSWRGRRDVLAP